MMLQTPLHVSRASSQSCESDRIWMAPLLTHQELVDTRLAVSELEKESSRGSSDHHPTDEDLSTARKPLRTCQLQKPADPALTHTPTPTPGLLVAATIHADTLWWPAFLRPAKDGW